MNPKVAQVLLSSVSSPFDQSLRRSNLCLPFKSVGYRPLWTLASSLPPVAAWWRRQPRIVHSLTQHAGPKNPAPDRALEKPTQRQRDANVEQFAARLYAAFRTKTPLETRKPSKSRRPLPSSNTISRPPEMYVGIAKLIQDCRETAQTIYMSRKLIFGFALTFAISEALFTLEIASNFGEYSQEQLTTRWLAGYEAIAKLCNQNIQMTAIL